MADTLKKMKIIIIVLSILLGLSLAALAGVIIYGQFNPSNGSAVIPDNYIEPASSGELNTVAHSFAQVPYCCVRPFRQSTFRAIFP